MSELIPIEDMNYLAQQSQGKINMILSGMTALMNDTEDKTEKIEKQNWFQRMVKTVTGKNTYTLLTFRAYNDKLIIEKVENYKNGKLDGYYSESTFSKGIQGYYKNGKKHGFWRYSYDTSIIKSGYYKHGKEYGIWLIEGPDTDMQPTKIYYKNGVKIEK